MAIEIREIGRSSYQTGHIAHRAVNVPPGGQQARPLARSWTISSMSRFPGIAACYEEGRTFCGYSASHLWAILLAQSPQLRLSSVDQRTHMRRSIEAWISSGMIDIVSS